MINKKTEKNIPFCKTQFTLIPSKTPDPGQKYDVIVIDPPWPSSRTRKRDAATMPITSIAALELPCRDDCHLFLWVPGECLENGLDILSGWKVLYQYAFIWHKPEGPKQKGVPEDNCLFALYGRKGIPKALDATCLQICFSASGKNGCKPQEFFEMVRNASKGNRLIIFGGQVFPGFDLWDGENDTCSSPEPLAVTNNPTGGK